MNHFRYIKTAQVEEISGGDKDFLIELTDIFLGQIDDFTSKMADALQNKNWDKLGKEAHTAKSSAMTFGMDDTGVLLKNIQLQCEANDLDTVPEMVHDAIEQLKGAIPELEAYKLSI